MNQEEHDYWNYMNRVAPEETKKFTGIKKIPIGSLRKHSLSPLFVARYDYIPTFKTLWNEYRRTKLNSNLRRNFIYGK